MKKYIVVAYEDEENKLPKQSKTIEAESELRARIVGWKMFPEYHEIGVFEVEP